MIKITSNDRDALYKGFVFCSHCQEKKEFRYNRPKNLNEKLVRLDFSRNTETLYLKGDNDTSDSVILSGYCTCNNYISEIVNLKEID